MPVGLLLERVGRVQQGAFRPDLLYRLEVVRRRSTYRRTKAQDRLHLLEGLLLALLDIDEVIQVIRTSEDVAEARERLRQVFDLSEVQANEKVVEVYLGR